MPELPEVQTTVDGLNQKIKSKIIVDVWTDLAQIKPSLSHFFQTIKSADFFIFFKKETIGAKVLKSERRAKNIFIHLSNKNTVWVHMKMTGHLMYGKYEYDKKLNSWFPSPDEKNKALRDPYNRFLHVVFSFSNGKHLVFSDARKFGKVTIFKTADFEKILQELNLGPEPLSISFSTESLKEGLQKKKNRPIKEALLDQSVVSGVGNIYSDEALWLSAIHPKRLVSSLSINELKKLTKSIQKVLRSGLKNGGDSMSDYRDINGKAGNFQNKHKAYRQTNKPCSKKGCTGIIQKIVIAGRSSHFCPVHQK